MLRGWMPAGWALLGGLLPALRFGCFSYWGDSYCGGAIAATGGALLLGAFPRILRAARPRDALLLAVGLALLANSRPYEGLILSIPVGVGLSIGMLRGKSLPISIFVRRVVLPAVAVLTFTGIAMGYFFWKTTGDPLRMPYQVNRASYGAAPYFLWQTPPLRPAYRHDVMRDFYVNVELAAYQRALSIEGFARETAIKLLVAWGFYIGPALTIPLLALPWAVRDRKIRWLLISGAISLAGTAMVAFFVPHYVATITGVQMAIVVQGMRHLCVWRPQGKPLGKALVRATVGTCLMMVPVHAWVNASATDAGSMHEMGSKRAGIEARLQSMPAGQLVLVTYNTGHDPLQEWVYNGADIDGSKVVWARDMGPEKNEELIEYYRNRRVWRLEADEKSPKLYPYQ
jgi:hypothetical protein